MAKPKVKLNGVTYWYPESSRISRRAKIGEGTIIHADCDIHDDVRIGRNCKIQPKVFIPNGITIEEDVFIGPGVMFANDKKLIGFHPNFEPDRTLIKHDVRIGMGALINGGVLIGENAIIGMGSVVLDNCEAGGTYVGSPARRIK